VLLKLLVKFLQLLAPQAQVVQSQNVLKLNPIPSSQVNPNAKVASDEGECKTSGGGGVGSMREVDGLVRGREVGRRSQKKTWVRSGGRKIKSKGRPRRKKR
jgi:hypothetical protein